MRVSMSSSIVGALAAVIRGEPTSWSAVLSTPERVVDAFAFHGVTGLVHERLNSAYGGHD